MRKLLVTLAVVSGTLLLPGAHTALAMEGEGDYGEFQRLMLTPLPELTGKADAILKKKYESQVNETIPLFTMVNQSSYVAYRIATVKPELLAAYDYYGTCNGRKLRTLLECFLRDGKPADYVPAAASCPICYNEAISVFLWNEIGVAPTDIRDGLHLLYDWSSR